MNDVGTISFFVFSSIMTLIRILYIVLYMIYHIQINNYTIISIVFSFTGYVLFILGIIYNGYSNDLSEKENWKKIIFWMGVLLMNFALILFIIGYYKGESNIKIDNYI